MSDTPADLLKVSACMREYFKCKQMIRNLKQVRSSYLSVNRCEEPSNCIDDLREGALYINYVWFASTDISGTPRFCSSAVAAQSC